MPDDRIVRVSLPRGVWAVIALFALLMAANFVAQLLAIEDQRSSLDRQLAINARQSARAIPLIDETRPLIEEVREALPAVAGSGTRHRS